MTVRTHILDDIRNDKTLFELILKEIITFVLDPNLLNASVPNGYYKILLPVIGFYKINVLIFYYRGKEYPAPFFENQSVKFHYNWCSYLALKT